MRTVHSENMQSVIEVARHSSVYPTQSCSWGWFSFGALVGLLGGIVSALLGSVLTGITWITGTAGNGVYMHTLGADFLLLTIPLLILGGVCMDLEDKRKKELERHGDN